MGCGAEPKSNTSGSASRIVMLACIYAAMTAVGVVIGTIIMEVTTPSASLTIFNGVLQAVATGTFLYITFQEVLEGELSHRSPAVKMVSLVAGFAIMALLAIEDAPAMAHGSE